MTFIYTGKQKNSCDLLYCKYCSNLELNPQSLKYACSKKNFQMYY